MLSETEIKARRMVIESIEKLIEKTSKKAEKEKAKKKQAHVTYKGECYYSEAELQDAYGCDAFSMATYDRLVDKLYKAKGNQDDFDRFTPSEILLQELNEIKSNFEIELFQDEKSKERKVQQEARAEELAKEGYSFREIETIIGNEELMRYE